MVSLGKTPSNTRALPKTGAYEWQRRSQLRDLYDTEALAPKPSSKLSGNDSRERS